MAVNLSMLAGAGAQFFTDSGVILSGGLVYTYAAGTTTPQTTYTTSAGNVAHTNPIVLNSAGRIASGGEIWLTDAVSYKFVLQTSAAVTIATYDNITGNSSGIYATFAASSGSSLVGFIQSGTGAVATTVQTKLRESVSITDFGGAAGASDNTAAMNAAADYLNTTFGGGVILIPYVGEWRMNWVCLYNSITVQGVGGKAEFNENCIRPYVITSAAITFGDGTIIVRYCGLDNVHISGVPVAGSGAGGVTQYALNAPHALRLRGGVVNFTADRVVLYNGVKSLSLEPSATQPVTGVRFNNGKIRNDITNSANARCIYMVRLADPGYCTDNKITQTKVNGPTIGYAAEIDGTAVGIAFEVSNSYWDIKPGYGVLLKGASQIIGFNTQLDPGALGAIVIEADNNGDIARFVVGYFRNGGQQFKTPAYTWTLPTEADTFNYRARINTAFLSPITYLSQIADPYNTTVAIERTTSAASAPVRLAGADFHVAKELYVYGGNGTAACILTASTVNGGAYLGALGTNQNVRLVPSGTGSNVLAGAGTYPSEDNTQPLGLAGDRWSVVYAGTGTINTSDAREKQQIRNLSDSENAVAVRLKSLIKAFKFNDAVQVKGDAARIHVGVIAQEVIAAFEAEGLNPMRYGIVCYDEWEATEDQPAGNRYGVRYEELFAFVLACI